MGNNPICRFCGFCDKNRVNNGKIRCTRWSTWVNPNDTNKCYFDWFGNEIKKAWLKAEGKDDATQD